MKIHFLLKLLIIILVIGQATAVDLSEYTLVKNFTSKAGFGVVSLGKFSPGESITINWLVTEPNLGYIFYYYGIDPLTGGYVTLHYNNSVNLGVKIGTSTTVKIERFYQEVFFSITSYRMPKFTFTITNSKGVKYTP